MAATVHVLRPQTPPIAGYLRVGHTGHRKLMDLHAAGRLPCRHLDPAIRSARHAVRLKIGDDKVLKALEASKVRLVRLDDALADLHETTLSETRSQAVKFRGGAKGLSAVIGR
jgi:hypothetical protein